MAEIMINGRIFETEEGTLLSRLLQKEDGFRMPCAGNGKCGKCRIYAKGQLSPPSEKEKALLTERELQSGIRLACQTRMYGPCQIEREEHGKIQVLLSETGGAQNRKAREGAPLFCRLGAAVDIGTTTIAAALYDENGLAARAGCENPQTAFGADVISRIEKGMAGKTEELSRIVQNGIARLLEQLCKSVKSRADRIDRIVITGNTAMLYLLTGRNPECLAHAPFQADWLAGMWTKMPALGCRNAGVYLAPCVSAFVGGDTVTAMLHTDLRKGKGVRMLVDIGTNGEIVLWKDGKLLCCSTAAGPAFEGVGLSMGMQGEEGAISHVALEHNCLKAEVIGNGMPKGICGSGVIDAVSLLLQIGQLDETGYLEGGEAYIAGAVKLTQQDIRQVQLAKGAICAGMKTLLRRAQMAAEELDELQIAGGFGSFLNLQSAQRIGLIPAIRPERIRVCGNAALEGAVDLLRKGEGISQALALARQAQTIELSTDPFFRECYIEEMLFPDQT